MVARGRIGRRVGDQLTDPSNRWPGLPNGLDDRRTRRETWVLTRQEALAGGRCLVRAGKVYRRGEPARLLARGFCAREH
jgi:hypothetical protein